MSHGDRKDDWYCKHCSDYWGGHFVNRGHRKSCFKCQVAKECVFHGKPIATGPPSRRVVTPSKNNVDVKKENAKLRSELARLKSAAPGAPRAPDEESDEMAKLVADAKAIRGLAKESPILANALAALEARISELRATRLSVKPPSERLRQLEAEAKRKQKEVEGIQKKRAASARAYCKRAGGDRRAGCGCRGFGGFNRQTPGEDQPTRGGGPGEGDVGSPPGAGWRHQISSVGSSEIGLRGAGASYDKPRELASSRRKLAGDRRGVGKSATASGHPPSHTAAGRRGSSRDGRQQR